MLLQRSGGFPVGYIDERFTSQVSYFVGCFGRFKVTLICLIFESDLIRGRLVVIWVPRGRLDGFCGVC